MNYKFINEKGEHRHELNGHPLIGTSAVSSVIAKPLTWWAVGLALNCLGWTKIKEKKNGKYVETPKVLRRNAALEMLTNIVGMSPEQYLTLLDEAYYAHSKNLKETAGEGQDLHAELERFVKNHMENRMATYGPKIQTFV